MYVLLIQYTETRKRFFATVVQIYCTSNIICSCEVHQKMNLILCKCKAKLASPFMLVHGVCPDQRIWLPLFSICYFHHEKDSNAQCSKNQAHTLDSIIIGHSSTSNAILVYNPRNQRHYKLDSYKVNTYHLPSSV